MVNEYRGYTTIGVHDPLLPNLYSEKKTNWFELVENQYLVVVDDNGEDVDRFKWQDGKYKNVTSKTLESGTIGKVKPLNVEQKLAVDLLLDQTTTVKVLVGNFGSGKDFLMVSAAFMLLQEGAYEKVMWVRNNFEVKDSNPVGHLPGTLLDKIKWTAGPLMDHLGGSDALQTQVESGRVEIQHLGHIRGRDIRNTIIICSEAENLSRQHFQLLLGRIASGSVLFVNGDLRQCDAKIFEANSGIRAAVSCLSGNRLFSYVYMPHSVRSETAKLADLLD